MDSHSGPAAPSLGALWEVTSTLCAAGSSPANVGRNEKDRNTISCLLGFSRKLREFIYVENLLPL